MSTMKRTGSSTTSETDDKNTMMADKKRKRMISNRESARRSRMKKQKLMQDLTEEASTLQAANKSIAGKVEQAMDGFWKYAAENNVLRTQEMELTERLKALNGLIQHSGLALAVEFPRLPDLLLKPWPLPCPLQPCTASGLCLFQF